MREHFAHHPAFVITVDDRMQSVELSRGDSRTLRPEATDWSFGVSAAVPVVA
jgi:hypothetical protein